MARTRAEAAEAGRAARSGQARARMAEYRRDWSHRPAEDAAEHFGVTARTIGRWRAALGLPDARSPRREQVTGRLQ